MNTIKQLKKSLSYVMVICVCLISLFPFYWLLNTSLQPLEGLFHYPPSFFPQITPFAYLDYIKNSAILQWMRNSLYVGIISTVLSTLFALPAAYSISRFSYQGKPAMIFLVLLTQMLPPVLLSIPIYIIFAKIGLTNTLTVLVIIYTATTMPIGIWFLKGFFDSIPREMEEAAAIDGYSVMRTLFFILIPMLKPGIVATATWSFIIAWDEYLYAYTLVENNKLWTLSVGLASYMGQYSTPWNEIMMGAVLATMPVVIMFMFFQKHLVSGLTAGAVKG